MPENSNPEDDLFEAALLRSPGPERAAFLDGECRSDPQLRARVEMMLEGHLNAQNFLETLPDGVALERKIASPEAASLEQLGHIGPYKLLQKLGEGGCGLVYLAEQSQPVRRRVALKVIKLGMDTRSVIARFEAERQALALMDHPNIAKVFDAGVTETGRPYFVMELVRGIRISEYCDLNNLRTDQRLSIFIQVCHAIQHAHQKGIIHRDIKPSNILITLHDGVPVPKVIDFGIAKATCDQHLTDKTIFTAFEQFIGTPAYMSPEQAEMSGLDIDTRSDIYSLGVLLYELLTGSTPFDAKELLASGLDAMRKTIREKEPVRPSTKLSQTLVAADVRRRTSGGTEESASSRRRLQEQLHQLQGDLDWIIMKCLEKDRTRRYETANGLAADLKRHLSDEPVVARPPSAAYRFQKAFRRNKVVFTAAAAVAAALVIGLGAATVMFFRERLARKGEQQQRLTAQSAQKIAQTEQQRADAQASKASESEQQARRSFYASGMNLAHQAWNEGNLQRAQKLLLAHVPQAGKEDLRGFEWRYLWRLCQDESRFTFTNVHFAGVHHGLALASDGQAVIAASGDSLRWLDRHQQREVKAMTVSTNPINGLSMASDQPGLVAYHTDRINALSPTAKELLGGGLAPGLGGDLSEDYVGAFALSWDGVMLAASGPKSTANTVRIFDVKTGEPVGPGFSLGENEDITSLAFSPDAGYLACGIFGDKIHILEVPSLKSVNVLTGHTARVAFLAFDRAGSKLVARGDSHIRLWSFPEGRLLADFPGQGGAWGDLAFSPDGLWLASGASDHTVRVWNLARLEIPPTFLHGHTGAVRSVLFSRDGNELYTGSVDGTVKVWDVSAQGSTNILHHPGWNDEVSFSPDGALLAVADYFAHTAVLLDVASQRPIGNVGEHKTACRGAKFSPDGRLVATVGMWDDVQIWSISPIKRIWNFPKVDFCGSVAFHPSKPLLAVGCGDLRFWDLQNGTRISLLAAAPTNDVRSVCFSPNGNRLALGMENGEVSIWDFVTGRRLRSFHEHKKQISPLCFSHDGLRLASGSEDHQIVIYDVRRPSVIALLEGHTDWVFGLAFAPDDKTLVSTSWDGTIRFWSLANYQVALMLAPGGGAVNSVAFSPDGNLMATCGAGVTARFWPAAKWEDIDGSKKAKNTK